MNTPFKIMTRRGWLLMAAVVAAVTATGRGADELPGGDALAHAMPKETPNVVEQPAPMPTASTTRAAAPAAGVVATRPVVVEPAMPGVKVLINGAAAEKSKLVTNLWIETDIRQVIQDISSQTDTVIVCDQTVQGSISMSVKGMSISEVLERVCASGGYHFAKVKDYYVVGKADPGTPLFQRVADSERVTLSHILPDQVHTLLQPSMLPYVSFDKVSGTVVVTAPDGIRERILATIAMIDQPNPQVSIEAVVFELSETGSKELAVDWQFKAGNIGISSQNLVNTITYGADSDIGTHISASLRAIVESGKGQVLANPKVLVMNNTDAEIFVGEEKYFTLLSGQASNPYYTLQSIKAGVTLKATPSIGKNGQITLKMEPEVSDVVDAGADTLSGAAGGASASSPVVTRRHAKTVVDIADGQTLLLGGLIRDQHRKVIDKVPGAGDIPGAGALFRKITEENTRQEVVILLTVHIVDNPVNAADKVTSRLAQRYVTPLDALTAPVQKLTRGN